MYLLLIHNIPYDHRTYIDEHYELSIPYLTFHQYIISLCLFGYILSNGNFRNGPIVSNNLAEYYLRAGINLVKKFEGEVDLPWLLQSSSDLWKQHCCLYLSRTYQNDTPCKKSVKFAEKFISFQGKKYAA